MDEESKELLRQLIEKQAKDAGKPLSTDEINAKVNELSKNFGNASKATEDTTKRFKDLNVTVKDLDAVTTAQVRALQKESIQREYEAELLKSSAKALSEFGKNLISTTPGFGKYGAGLESFGSSIANASGKAADSLDSVSKGLGTTTRLLGKFAEGLTLLAGIYFKQADLLLKANDTVAQFGTAGSFTTKELMQLAHGAGVTSKNMDLFTKPIASLNNSLLTLGTTTGEGVKAFGQLTKFTSEQREQFQRLGISQEQMLQGTADYITLQAMAGRNIKSEIKDTQALQQASMDYQKNLVALASITGADVETVKKRQQEAANDMAFQVKQVQLENQARRLDAEGRTEEAKKLREEGKARNKALDSLSALGNETVTKGVRAFMATGTMAAEETQSLVRMGLGKDLSALQDAIKKGENVELASAKFKDAYNKKFGSTVDSIGFAAQHSAETARLFGLNNKSVADFNKQRDINYEKELTSGKKRVDDASKPGTDPSQDARATLTTLEIKAATAIDSLTAEINPLISGFNKTTIAGTAAAAALFGVATVAGGSLLKGMFGKAAAALSAAKTIAAGGAVATTAAPAAATAAGGAATVSSAAASAGSALGKLAGPMTNFAAKAPAIAAVVSIGEGLIDAYQGVRKAEKDLEAGKITKEEARTQKGEAIGGGTGTAVGGTAGALKGAAVGASIGSAVPVIGTVIGGLLGAALGGWLGSKAGKAVGEVAGGGIAKMTADADKEVDKAKKEADKKQQVKEQKTLTSKKDEIVKVSIVNPLPLPVKIVAAVGELEKLTVSKGQEKELGKSGIVDFIKSVVTFSPLGFLAKMASTSVTGSSKDSATKTQVVTTEKQKLDYTLSEKTLAEKDQKLYKEYIDRKNEIFKKELKAGSDRQTARMIANDQARDEFAERAAKVGAAKVRENSKTKTTTATVKEVESFDAAKFKERDPASHQKYIARVNELKKQNLLALEKELAEAKSPAEYRKKSSMGREKAEADAMNQAIKEFAPIAAKVGSATTEKVSKPEKKPIANGKITEKEIYEALLQKYGPKMREEISVQRDAREEASMISALPESERNKWLEDLFGEPTTLGKTNEDIKPVSPFTVQKGFKGPTEANLGQEKSTYFDKLIESSERLAETFDILSENFATMVGTYSAFDGKLKKDLTKNIPAEFGDKIKDSFKAGMTDAVTLRSDLRGGEEGAAPSLMDRFTGLFSRVFKRPEPPAAPEKSVADKGIAEKGVMPPPSMPSGPSKPPAAKQDVQKNLGDLKSVLQSKGLGDQQYINAILANVMKETGGKTTEENLNYSKTSNERIRKIFGSRAQGVSDKDLNRIKADPKQMGEFMYGSSTSMGKRMGNTEPGDGWKYRGRGYIQLTGKNNYSQASKAIFGDDRLVKDPDLVNEPTIASEVTAWYMQTTKGNMQQRLGLGSGPMSQVQANQLATSQVAGTVVQRGSGYLGETLATVDKYSKQVASITPTAKPLKVRADLGSIIEGPTSGYPVDLTAHGREVIAPLQPNSVLEMLSKTPATANADTITTTANTAENPGQIPMKELLAMNERMINVMQERMDIMIEQLSKSVNTQDKLLQVARV